MKNKSQHAHGLVQKADFTFLKSKQATQTLRYILSPLEQAALRHNYQPFTYKLDGVRIYISSGLCKSLVNITTQKAELLILAIQMEKSAKHIPHKLRDVFDDPRIILALPPRLRSHLCRLQCYTMLAIIQKGRRYFADEQKFSPRAMQTLDALFTKYKSINLFK